MDAADREKAIRAFAALLAKPLRQGLEETNRDFQDSGRFDGETAKSSARVTALLDDLEALFVRHSTELSVSTVGVAGLSFFKDVGELSAKLTLASRG